MATINYKEKYEKAVHAAMLAKQDTESAVTIRILEKIFPELKETEDERIRKALVEMVHDTTGDSLWVDYDVHKDDALNWLEKQGEQKDILENAILDSNEDGLIAETIRAKQGEQNPAWSEEDEDYYDAIIAKLEVTQDDALLTDNQMEFLKSLKDRVQPQPKSDWCEEDERYIQIAISDTLDKGHPTTSNWLKSLKERFVTPQKQEWSEEDEDILKEITADIKLTGDINDEQAKSNKKIDWLKSLNPQFHKDKVNNFFDALKDCGYTQNEIHRLKSLWKQAKWFQPKNHWKPSDEQMEALANALSLAKNCGEESAFELRTLHEQLSKLRE